MKQMSFSFIFVSILAINAQPPPSDMSCFQGNKVVANECCLVPSFVDPAINSKCDEEFKGSHLPPPGVQAREGSCVIECKFSMTGMFVDGKLVLDKVNQVLDKTVGADKNHEPLLRGAVEECYSYVMSNPAYSVKPVPATPGRAGCSFIPQGFLNCVKKKLFMNCPKGHWSAVDGCEQLKQKLTAGCSYHSITVGSKSANG